ncbi:hypothetical protein LAY57_32010 [Argonema antarcticum A004/B2]|nr:hypothetical protein [Argonema antarcticum A004/B2]
MTTDNFSHHAYATDATGHDMIGYFCQAALGNGDGNCNIISDLRFKF